MAFELPPFPVQQPKPDNQKRGRENREAGKAFEAELDKAFSYYHEKGYAQIDKTPEPMKILKRLSQGRFTACFLKKAQPDYKGTIKGGRSVMFEAKYTATDRIKQDAVNEEQTRYLENASLLGARCYVVVGFSTGGVYRVPWKVWASMKSQFGHKYATENDLKLYAVPRAWNDRLMILN